MTELPHTRDADHPPLQPHVIRTVSGVYVNYLDPDPHTITLPDMAWGLAHANRFAGHTAAGYSVAEHSIIVANQLLRRFQLPDLALAGLLHDGPEAYLGDIVGTLKPLLIGYAPIEARFADVIERVYLRGGLHLDDPRIKAVDKECFDWETAFVRDNPARIAPAPRDVVAHFLTLARRLRG